MEKFLGSRKILCLSPHPDDVELSMAGTIMRYSETIFDILCLTIGSSGDSSSSIKRRDEVNFFWKDISNVNLFFSDSNFKSDKSQEEWLKYLDTFISNKGYDFMAIPPKEDSHYEHVFFHKIALSSLRNNKISSFSYNTVSSLNSWPNNLVVDIKNNYETKIKRLLSAFKSQAKHPYFNEDILDTFHKNYRSHKRGIKHAECFNIEQLYI